MAKKQNKEKARLWGSIEWDEYGKFYSPKQNHYTKRLGNFPVLSVAPEVKGDRLVQYRFPSILAFADVGVQNLATCVGREDIGDSSRRVTTITHTGEVLVEHLSEHLKIDEQALLNYDKNNPLINPKVRTPWAGTSSLESAIQLVNHGWPAARELAAAASFLAQEWIAVSAPRRTRAWGETGLVSVDRVLDNADRPWRTSRLRNRPRDGIRILLDGCRAGDQSSYEAFAPGIFALALWRYCTTIGIPCDVTWACTILAGYTNLTAIVPLLTASNPVFSEHRVIFGMTNPAMLRRFFFALEEICGIESVRVVTKENSYGMCTEVKLHGDELSEYNVVIGKWGTPLDEVIRTTTTILAQQGIDISISPKTLQKLTAHFSNGGGQFEDWGN